MPNPHEFSVYQFFPDDLYECLRAHVTAEEAVRVATDYSRASRPAVMMGITQRVIITDGGDAIVWEWKRGEGLIWPPKEDA